jgi:hypothetical protein
MLDLALLPPEWPAGEPYDDQQTVTPRTKRNRWRLERAAKVSRSRDWTGRAGHTIAKLVISCNRAGVSNGPASYHRCPFGGPQCSEGVSPLRHALA